MGQQFLVKGEGAGHVCTEIEANKSRPGWRRAGSTVLGLDGSTVHGLEWTEPPPCEQKDIHD